MKSLYLLCEHGVSISLIEKLEQNNISFDDILHDNKKLTVLTDKFLNQKKRNTYSCAKVKSMY